MRPCAQFRMSLAATVLHRRVGQDEEAKEEGWACQLGASRLSTEDRQVRDANLESGLHRLRAKEMGFERTTEP